MKRQATEGMAEVFATKGSRHKEMGEAQIKELHAKIGQLTIRARFFGQGLRSLSFDRRKEKVESNHHQGLSIARQCEILGISRSSFYYEAKGENPLNLKFMRMIDEQFLETPWYGSRQMARWLQREGHRVGRKRVVRLMRKMGLTPVYQKPSTSKSQPGHKIYPYLLRGVDVVEPGHVWCADITYIPMRRGFLYLVAVMDWASRKVLSWCLSNTLEADFCVAALKEALQRFPKPLIFRGGPQK